MPSQQESTENDGTLRIIGQTVEGVGHKSRLTATDAARLAGIPRPLIVRDCWSQILSAVC